MRSRTIYDRELNATATGPVDSVGAARFRVVEDVSKDGAYSFRVLKKVRDPEDHWRTWWDDDLPLDVMDNVLRLAAGQVQSDARSSRDNAQDSVRAAALRVEAARRTIDEMRKQVPSLLITKAL